MDEPIFRPAQDADMPEVRRIAREAWAAIYEHFRRAMGDALFRLETPGDYLGRTADGVATHFRDHPQWAFVTELEGRIVGFCTYRLRDDGVGSIGYNSVDPACQGRGVGTTQYRECLRRMRQAGMRYAHVRTGLDESHAPARRAYEKVGFVAIRPEVDYYLEL